MLRFRHDLCKCWEIAIVKAFSWSRCDMGSRRYEEVITFNRQSWSHKCHVGDQTCPNNWHQLQHNTDNVIDITWPAKVPSDRPMGRVLSSWIFPVAFRAGAQLTVTMRLSVFSHGPQMCPLRYGQYTAPKRSKLQLNKPKISSVMRNFQLIRFRSLQSRLITWRTETENVKH